MAKYALARGDGRSIGRGPRIRTDRPVVVVVVDAPAPAAAAAAVELVPPIDSPIPLSDSSKASVRSLETGLETMTAESDGDDESRTECICRTFIVFAAAQEVSAPAVSEIVGVQLLLINRGRWCVGACPCEDERPG